MVNCSLNFAKINFTYTPQKADGTPDADVDAGLGHRGRQEGVSVREQPDAVPCDRTA